MAVPPPTTILVIDDEPSLLRGVARVLRREGYTVATAANGRHALAQLQVQLYDVILSDLQMPDIDGRAFYALLRQQYPALCKRVIFSPGRPVRPTTARSWRSVANRGYASRSPLPCSAVPLRRCWMVPRLRSGAHGQAASGARLPASREVAAALAVVGTTGRVPTPCG